MKMRNLLGVYPVRKARFIVMGVAASVMALIGLLILWAAWEVASGGISYSGSGNPVVLLGSIGGGVFLLGAGLVYASFALRSKVSFVLYEDGIVVKQKKAADVSLLFTEIEDVLHFGEGLELRTTHLSFRKNPASKWFTVDASIVDHFALMDQFRELHTEQRAGFLSDKWEKSGSPVEIKYLASTLLKKEYLALNLAGFLKRYSTCKTLQLAKNHIKIDGKRIDFDRNYKLEEGDWTNKMYLKDSKGEEKFSINYFDVLSADVFFALLSSQLADEEK
jgi:hypothetical protein